MAAKKSARDPLTRRSRTKPICAHGFVFPSFPFAFETVW